MANKWRFLANIAQKNLNKLGMIDLIFLGIENSVALKRNRTWEIVKNVWAIIRPYNWTIFYKKKLEEGLAHECFRPNWATKYAYFNQFFMWLFCFSVNISRIHNRHIKKYKNFNQQLNSDWTSESCNDNIRKHLLTSKKRVGVK